MLTPTSEQLDCLEGFERAAFRFSDFFHRNPAANKAAMKYLSTFGASWVDVTTRRLRYVQGTEHIRNLRPERGVILVSNHRSFFDLYVTSSVMFNETNWIEHMCFPVRSTFFYEGPAGIAVNMVMSAMAMYPPILRDANRKAFNQYAVDVMVEMAKKRGTLLGFHPEGTRGKGDNPYELLPAHPGVGQIVRLARPVVIPAFILGLCNDFPRQVRSNFDGTGEPVTLTFGPPVELGSLLDEEPKLRTFKKIADVLRSKITELGEQDKLTRKRLGLPSKEPPQAP
jgi:1-acyl-sn-glycerol-3-phosphate acyltransferase